MITTIKNLLFPNEICLFCGAEECRCRCLDEVFLIEPHSCRKCGRHDDARELYGLCRRCRDVATYYDANYSAAYYRGTIKKALMDFKYRDALYFREYLGTMLYEKYLYEKRNLAEIRAVTYIPISLSRQSVRGYNQSKELAEVFSALSGIPVFPLLERVKNTKRLKTLGRKEREEELKNSMKVREKYLTIIGENKILIIDDIFTTGSTVNEAARCLKEAGAAVVKSLTVASR